MSDELARLLDFVKGTVAEDCQLNTEYEGKMVKLSPEGPYTYKTIPDVLEVAYCIEGVRGGGPFVAVSFKDYMYPGNEAGCLIMGKEYMEVL